MALAAPDLDDAVIEESWPALAALSLDRGPAATPIDVAGLALTVGVPEGGAREAALAELTREIEAALDQSSLLDVYTGGERFRFRMTPDVRGADLTGVIGALNAVLTARGSEKRLLELAPTRDPLAIGGTRAALLGAIEQGELRPASTR
jgi:hypothetical protein